LILHTGNRDQIPAWKSTPISRDNLRAAPKLKGHDFSVAGLAFLHDDRYLVSAGFASTIRVYKISTGKEVCDIENLKFLTRLAPIGRTGKIATFEKTLRLWDFSDPSAPTRIKHPPEFGDCSRWAFSTDGKRLVTATNQGLTDMFTKDPPAIEIWDVSRGKRLSRFQGQEKNNVTCMSLSPGSRFLAIGYFFGSANVEVRELRTGQLVGTYAGHAFPPLAMSFSPDGTFLATGGCVVGDMILWDIKNACAKKRVVAAHRDSIQCLAFSPDGKRLFSGSSDHTVKVWTFADLSVGKLTGR
jgi:WD40 repeat protein